MSGFVHGLCHVCLSVPRLRQPGGSDPPCQLGAGPERVAAQICTLALSVSLNYETRLRGPSLTMWRRGGGPVAWRGVQWEAGEGRWGALVAGLWVWGITGSFGWRRRKATVPGSCCMMGAHCGVWGTAAQRRDPQQPFLCPPFHPHNWLLTGELSPFHTGLEPAFSPFARGSVISSPVAALLAFLLSPYALLVHSSCGSQLGLKSLLGTLLTSLSPQKEPGPWQVFQDPCWAPVSLTCDLLPTPTATLGQPSPLP